MKTITRIKQNSVTPQSAQAAFDSINHELEAVRADELLQINVDIPSACVTALGAAQRLDTIRDQIARLPAFDRSALEKLRVYALGLLYANAVATNDTGEDLVTTLLVEASPLKGNLLVGAEALAYRGLVSAKRVAQIRAGHGHLDTASDLIALSAVYDEIWDDVKDKTTVTREEVDRAAVLGPQLHVALGTRRVADGVAKTGESQLARQRAFTLFARAYDECRRVATYLRWHEGDVDDFAPSIYTKRRRRAARAAGVATELRIVEEPSAVAEPEPLTPTPAVG